MTNITMGFEKFGAYQKALEFYSFSLNLIESVPLGNSGLIEQFRRAALSIVLNIAEGSGKAIGKDRNRFYRIAIGSAMECGALLDICMIVKLSTADKATQGKDLLGHIVGILSNVIIKKG